MSERYDGDAAGVRKHLPDVIPSLWPLMTSLDRRYAERNYARILSDPAKYDWMLKLGRGEWRYAQLACTLAFYAVARFLLIPTGLSVVLVYLGVQFSAVLTGFGVLLTAAAVAGIVERARVSRRTNAYFTAGNP